MGERGTWVVREGKIRGEGRYRAPGIPAWTGGRWAPTIKDAFRFTSRSMAMRNARKCKGRPVRLVTIPEQLRRAQRAASYQRGRADERAAVVGWLRAMNDTYSAASPVLVHNRCEAIESGEHVMGGGK